MTKQLHRASSFLRLICFLCPQDAFVCTGILIGLTLIFVANRWIKALHCHHLALHSYGTPLRILPNGCFLPCSSHTPAVSEPTPHVNIQFNISRFCC